LICGEVVGRLLALRLEKEMFVKERSKVMAELGDESDFGIWNCYVVSATTALT
jgi:hypothetical protein